MKIRTFQGQSLIRLIPAILFLILLSSTKCHYGDLSDVDSTFQSMFSNFSKIFESPPPRKLEKNQPSPIQEVDFTDANGNLKPATEIKKEIQQKFNVENTDGLNLDSVLGDLMGKGVSEGNGRSLGVESKLQKAMNMGLGGEILSQDPDYKEKDLVKKGKNFVEFENSANINDSLNKKIKTSKGDGNLREKTWGSESVKHRIGENGLKTIESLRKSNKIMKQTMPNGSGEESIQQMSFSSSGGSLEDPEMNAFTFPEDEIQKMNEIQNRMKVDMDDMFVSPEEFARVTPPRELRMRRRRRSKKNKKSRKHKKKRKNRKLNNYDYDYPESVYGFNSHVIENPSNCPNCGQDPFIPTISDEEYFPNQELNQFQENNYLDNKVTNNQQNMQQNNINHYHTHHHQAFDPALASNIGVEDYDKMEKLYQDYLGAVMEFNHEVPSTGSARAVNKHMTVLQNQLVNHHKKNPYFGSDPIMLPPMMSTDSELALHYPQNQTISVTPETTVHHHYVMPSPSQYMFQAPTMPMAMAPTPTMIHNYQLLMDAPHPMAGMVQEQTKEELQHVKQDLEIEFKNDLEIEIGHVMKHEDDLQKHTDEEINHLLDMTRVMGTKTAPTLNVEHTVMGVDGHQIHETKDGEIIVENHSESHSIHHGRGGSASGDYYGDSEHTEVIQKVTPIIIGNPGFGGSASSYSGDSSNSSGSSRVSDYKNKTNQIDVGSEKIIVENQNLVDGQEVKQNQEINQNQTENIMDHDEDHSSLEESSVEDSSNIQSKNSIYNEKNTHIVHHMGAPNDEKTLNINLDLLSDGKGGFYFEGKDGKAIGSAGTLTDKYDILNHQINTLRSEEVENFKKTGTMSKDGQIGEAQPLDNMGDENVVTQIDGVEDLHEVTNEDLTKINQMKPEDLETGVIQPNDRLSDSSLENADHLSEAQNIEALDQVQENESVHQDLSETEKEGMMNNIVTELPDDLDNVSSIESSDENITNLSESQKDHTSPENIIEEAEVMSHHTSETNIGDVEVERQPIASHVSDQIQEDEQNPSHLTESSNAIQEADQIPVQENIENIQDGDVTRAQISPDLNEDQLDTESPEIISEIDNVDNNPLDSEDLQEEVITQDNLSETQDSTVNQESPITQDEDVIDQDALSETDQSTVPENEDVIDQNDLSETDKSTVNKDEDVIDQDALSETDQSIINEDENVTVQDDLSETNASTANELSQEVNLDNANPSESQDLIDQENLSETDSSSKIDETISQDDLSESDKSTVDQNEDQDQVIVQDDLSESDNSTVDKNEDQVTVQDDLSESDNSTVDENAEEVTVQDDLSESDKSTQEKASESADVISQDDLSESEKSTKNEDNLMARKLGNFENLNRNPFKNKPDIFEEYGRNFITNPIKPRSMKQIAEDFDKNFKNLESNNDKKQNKIEFVEPRELFEDLDITSKLRANLGIGATQENEYKPLF